MIEYYKSLFFSKIYFSMILIIFNKSVSKSKKRPASGIFTTETIKKNNKQQR